jgi:LmbE family N-acetylglucosaminyl deacetylase
MRKRGQAPVLHGTLFDGRVFVSVAMAVGAHPDDIEFMMAGTLLRLKEAGAEIHMWNLANGCCGSSVHDREETAKLRWEEAQESARMAGATMHPPLVDDLAIVYDTALLARVAAVVRKVGPDILLIPSSQDYMEDHTNASRLLVTAGFVRGMRNYETDPPSEPWTGPTVLYHAMPHGLRDGLRRLVRPGVYVDVEPVLDIKRAMLAKHSTQREWLATSQGPGSYLDEMESMSRKVGEMSKRFTFAEGWRRHAHIGLSLPESDPLKRVLGEACLVDSQYELELG